jgi:ribosome-associated protein
LNQLQALKSRPKSTTRLSRSSRVFKTIINAIHEKKGERVISLDLRKIHEAVADFFIICEATTSTQVKAIGDFVQEKLKEECDEIPFKHEGYQHAKWILVDYVNVVVHVMQPETRRFYQLEELWSDADLMEHFES